jgi:N-acetylmuramic acid 6-phosphate etherase
MSQTFPSPTLSAGPASETTETRAARFSGLDVWSAREVARTLWAGQSQAIAACMPATDALADAAEAAAERLASDSLGRLFYVGAGSSGMIGALDGLELADTFGWPRERLVLLSPSGLDLSRGLDAAGEDDASTGRARMLERAPAREDVVVALSAGGRSVFVHAAAQAAREAGALTIGLACVSPSPLLEAVERAVFLPTGAEVIAGSTRLGAGTAQKAALNIFSTVLMTRLGAVHGNLMVNLRPLNAKLRERCVGMVAEIARVDASTAKEAFAAEGDVRRAVLRLAGLERERIGPALEAAGGALRIALADMDARRAGEKARDTST